MILTRAWILDCVKVTESGCWEWISQPGTKRPMIGGKLLARVVYELWFGEFDQSLKVCHECDNTKCINPAHLFLGTQKENCIDWSRKGRYPGMLTPEVVASVRASKGTLSQIAMAHSISVCSVHRIRTGTRYNYDSRLLDV